MNNPTRLIINADDFGILPQIDRAVLTAANLGTVTSTTTIVNYGKWMSSVESAKKIPNLGVGIHLNLTMGPSTLPPHKVPLLVNHDGFFKYSLKEIISLHLKRKIDKDLCQQVYNEFSQQIKIFKSYGFTPTHVDSHQHIHIIPELTPVFWQVAKENGISRVRHVNEPLFPYLKHESLAYNTFGGGILRWLFMKRCITSLPKQLVSTDCFLGLVSSGRWRTNMFANVLNSIKCKYTSIEIGVHPAELNPTTPEESQALGDEDFDKWVSLNERQTEANLLKDFNLLHDLKEMNFQLSNYTNLYNTTHG